MNIFLFVTEKTWHDGLFDKLSSNDSAKWIRIFKREEFTEEKIRVLNPDKIFILHWSYIIPPQIHQSYECIVFHMTDLPFGRGGSPLQNLISRGIYSTTISAIRVNEGLDTGDIYLKRPLSLEGSAQEIFIRSSDIIGEMIREIILTPLTPTPQQGEPVIFKRRKPAEGNLALLTSLHQVYDYIRMLDAEGYPSAFIEVGKFRIEFRSAVLKSDNSIKADVRIIEK